MMDTPTAAAAADTAVVIDLIEEAVDSGKESMRPPHLLASPSRTTVVPLVAGRPPKGLGWWRGDLQKSTQDEALPLRPTSLLPEHHARLLAILKKVHFPVSRRAAVEGKGTCRGMTQSATQSYVSDCPIMNEASKYLLEILPA